MKFAENLKTKVIVRWNKALFLSFIFGFVVRLIPEVLSFPYPIGFDPIWYAWRIRSGVVWYNWSQVFSTWLLYGILVPLYNATQVNLFVLLKSTAALLFGFNACGVYYFATKALSWTVKKGLLASIFFSLQAAALFLSSNLYRNMLGLGILLFTLPLIKDDLKSTKRFVAFVLLSMLVVLSHEIASVILFTIVLGFLVTKFLRGVKMSVPRHLIAVIPAFVLFLVSFYFMVSFGSYPIEKNGITLNEPSGNYEGALFFFRNYLAVPAAHQQPVYLDLASQVLSFFAVLYVLTLPFVFIGFFKDAVLDSWTAFLLIGSFGALVMPVFAPSIWSRWLLMLVYPFTFYAVSGVARVLQSTRNGADWAFGRAKWMKLSKIAIMLVMIVPILSGLVYAGMAMPAQISVVPLGDFDDTAKALRWLDSKMGEGSVMLAHFAFFWWSRLYLNENHTRIYFKDDVEGALSLALQRGYSDVYFVWWNQKISWFSVTVPNGFASVFESGRISVLKYSG